MHFIAPFKLIVSGPSSSGKTQFVLRLLSEKEQMIWGKPIKKIIWCCRQKLFVPVLLHRIPNVIVNEGLPDMSNVEENSLIVFDDLMLQSFTRDICEMFTINSHHRSISCILILQNIFHRGQFCRDISLNCQYIVLFKNPRDQSQFGALARQIAPDKWRELEKVYKTVTKSPWSNLVLDLTQEALDIYRFKTNIFNPDYFECYSSLDDVKRYCQKIIKIEKEPFFVTSTKTG